MRTRFINPSCGDGKLIICSTLRKERSYFGVRGCPDTGKRYTVFFFISFFWGLAKWRHPAQLRLIHFGFHQKSLFPSLWGKNNKRSHSRSSRRRRKKIFFIHRHHCCDAAIRVLWAIGCLAGNKWKSLGRRTTRGRVVENMSAAAASEPPNWTEHDAFQLLENTREQKISSLNIVLPERAVIRPNRYPLFWNTFSQQRHLAKVLRLQNVRPGCVPHHLICP